MAALRLPQLGPVRFKPEDVWYNLTPMGSAVGKAANAPVKVARGWVDNVWSIGRKPARLEPEQVVKAPAAPVAPQVKTASDDVLRNADDLIKPPAAPLQGAQRNRNFPTAFVVKSGVIGTGAGAAAVYGPGVIERFGASTATVVGPEGPVGQAGETVTHFIERLLSGVGGGAGEGVFKFFSGVSEGVKSLALPALIIGGGFLLYNVAKK